jgi:hypothetical protein
MVRSGTPSGEYVAACARNICNYRGELFISSAFIYEILRSPPRAHVSEALATRLPVSTQRYVIFNSSSFYPLFKYQ